MLQPLIIALLAVCACAFEVKQPQLAMMTGGGISFKLSDESGMELVAYHYNINSPLNQVDVGQYNVDVNQATNGYWVHKNPDAPVSEGDVVYYWVYVLHQGLGYQLLEQSWTATASSISSTTVSSKTTTSGTATTTPRAPTTTTEKEATSRASGTTTTTENPDARSLIFEDTFDTFDLDTWKHEITAGGGGNWEFQYYTNNRSNSYVRDGVLYLKPTLTSDKEGEEFLTSGHLSIWGASPADLCTGNNWWGCERSGSFNNILNPIQSARLRTAESFAFKYGKVEVIAEMPEGDWLWPAIWLLPKHNVYGQWPASGEFDLVESRGNRNLRAGDGTHTGCEQVGMTMHWGPYWPLNGYLKTHNTKNLPSGQCFSEAFHNYTLVWTANDITFYLDGEVILTADPGNKGFFDFGDFENDHPGIDNPWKYSSNKMAPFDQEFYIILNVAVGGIGFFSDDDTNTPYDKPWLNTSPQAAKDFYDAKANWYPTWHPNTNDGEDAAMKVKSVRVYALNP